MDLPICNGSLTERFLYSWSPRWNSSDELLARHEYKRMSSSLSGKLQYAIRNCNCSGTGGKTCSTNSNGIYEATHFAANSVNVVTWWSARWDNNNKSIRENEMVAIISNDFYCKSRSRIWRMNISNSNLNERNRIKCSVRKTMVGPDKVATTCEASIKTRKYIFSSIWFGWR